jgi:hypothetical protein
MSSANAYTSILVNASANFRSTDLIKQLKGESKDLVLEEWTMRRYDWVKQRNDMAN